MSSKIKLKNSLGNTTTIESSDSVTSDIKVIHLNTVEELTTAVGSDGDLAIVADLDRGGNFKYDSAATDNGGTVFGKWVRQYDGAVNVKWFGAKGDGITDDTQALKLALNNGGISLLENGTYIITESLIFKSGCGFVGESEENTIIKQANGSNIDIIVSENFTTGTIPNYEDVPNGIVIRQLTIDGNWLDWGTRQPDTTTTVNNTAGNGIKINARRVEIDCAVINCAESLVYFKSSGDYSGQFTNNSAKSIFRLKGWGCGKEGAILIGGDTVYDYISITAASVMVNNISPTSNSLIADSEVSGLYITGGDVLWSHISSVHQGINVGPGIKVAQGLVNFGISTVETCTKGVLLNGQTKGEFTIRDPKDTTASSYLMKINSDHNDVSIKARRYSPSNQYNADSDYKSIQIVGDNNQVDIHWFNGINTSTAELFKGDAVSISGDSNEIIANINAPKGSGIILENVANNNNIISNIKDGGVGVINHSAGANTVKASTYGCNTGLILNTLPNGGRYNFNVRKKENTDVYISGTFPNVLNYTTIDFIGINEVGAVDEVSNITGVQSGTILSGNTFALVTIPLPKKIVFTPSIADVLLSTADTSTTLITAKVYSINSTTLVVRLNTATAVASDTSVNIIYSISRGAL